ITLGLNPDEKPLLYAGTNLTAANTIDASAHRITGLFNGASSQIWVDGTSAVTGHASNNGYQGYQLGRFLTATADFYGGDLAEIIVYDSALSDTDRQDVEAYLYNKWFVAGGGGTTGTLSAMNHYRRRRTA